MWMGEGGLRCKERKKGDVVHAELRAGCNALHRFAPILALCLLTILLPRPPLQPDNSFTSITAEAANKVSYCRTLLI